MNAEEILELIKKQWADTKDIMSIGVCGKEKAIKIKQTIKKEIEDNGNFLPYGKVPMEKVVEYFKINISYLKKVSKGAN